MWRNLRQGAPVKLWLAGKNISGNAVVMEGNDQSTLIAQGLTTFMRRFPDSARQHHIQISSDGTIDQEDVERAAQSTIVVRVDLDE